MDTTASITCTNESYYCACALNSCADVGATCASGSDCCTDDLPDGYGVYCGTSGDGDTDYVCTEKLENCSGVPVDEGSSSCCGSIGITDTCCDSSTEAHGDACCGTTPYDTGSKTCCSGDIVASNACCHGEVYNPSSGKQQCCADVPCTIPTGAVCFVSSFCW